ncbi:hypothetical protein P7K49_032436 [Saguinus oedipus]|uniref:Uncharacterized protein n=1 Tax=Saguinus oedipus TaxID=9490 RepID=A0ABQ9TZ60_SAGOE|nr:hypothetical protein P7K49_032436 [Saguinus oedipus]
MQQVPVSVYTEKEPLNLGFPTCDMRDQEEECLLQITQAGVSNPPCPVTAGAGIQSVGTMDKRTSDPQTAQWTDPACGSLTPGRAQCSERGNFTTSTSSIFFMLFLQMAPSSFRFHLRRERPWLPSPQRGSTLACTHGCPDPGVASTLPCTHGCQTPVWLHPALHPRLPSPQRGSTLPCTHGCQTPVWLHPALHPRLPSPRCGSTLPCTHGCPVPGVAPPCPTPMAAQTPVWLHPGLHQRLPRPRCDSTLACTHGCTDPGVASTLPCTHGCPDPGVASTLACTHGCPDPGVASTLPCTLGAWPCLGWGVSGLLQAQAVFFFLFFNPRERTQRVTTRACPSPLPPTAGRTRKSPSFYREFFKD